MPNYGEYAEVHTPEPEESYQPLGDPSRFEPKNGTNATSSGNPNWTPDDEKAVEDARKQGARRYPSYVKPGCIDYFALDAKMRKG